MADTTKNSNNNNASNPILVSNYNDLFYLLGIISRIQIDIDPELFRSAILARFAPQNNESEQPK